MPHSRQAAAMLTQVATASVAWRQRTTHGVTTLLWELLTQVILLFHGDSTSDHYLQGPVWCSLQQMPFNLHKTRQGNA